LWGCGSQALSPGGPGLSAQCKAELDRNGALTLESFLVDSAIDAIRDAGLERQHLAYFTLDSRNIYLKLGDSELPMAHPRIRESG